CLRIIYQADFSSVLPNRQDGAEARQARVASQEPICSTFIKKFKKKFHLLKSLIISKLGQLPYSFFLLFPRSRYGIFRFLRQYL
ncbi:MAG: hypothetical protein KDD01_25840, partial [Phaeodactylibacter sp.]|nr:hypothetical protein [Phaeodactylibacter sp.]